MSCHRLRTSQHGGFTLAEILMAAAILAFGLVAVLSIYPPAIRITERMQRDEIGSRAALTTFEYLRSTHSSSGSDFASAIDDNNYYTATLPDLPKHDVLIKKLGPTTPAGRELYTLEITVYDKNRAPFDPSAASYTIDEDKKAEAEDYRVGTYICKGYFY